MINEMVALNDEEMARVNGGYKQNDINLLIASPTHIGNTPEKSVQEKSGDRA